MVAPGHLKRISVQSLAAALVFALFSFFMFDISLSETLVAFIFYALSILLLLHIYVKNNFVAPLNSMLLYIRRQRKKDPGSRDSAEDILVQIEQELRDWSEERMNEIENLKKLETYRKEFLGNVSHELKTPVFNIQGYLLTLLDGGINDPSINVAYLQRAEKSLERMIQIIQDLEAISQLETGQLELEPERFDIIALIREVVEAMEMEAKKKNISLLIKSGDHTEMPVIADKFRIRQVLTNLVVNSIKYGNSNGETKVKVFESGSKVLVEVEDNGIGISKDHLPRIFERFYRVDTSRSRELGGTGLGLAIVKHVIEAHNQSISVNSNEGVGTQFTFTLKKG